MYKKINKILIILMILITILTLIFNYKPDRLMTYILLIPTLCLPYIIKSIKIKLSDIDIMIYYIFLLFAETLGAIGDLYNTIWWYDILMHFLSGILTFYIGLVILKNINIQTNKKLFVIVFCLCFSGLVAVLWEIVEFTGDVLFNLDVQHNIDTGVYDTMEDMIVALLGSLLSSINYYIKYKKIHIY